MSKPTPHYHDNQPAISKLSLSARDRDADDADTEDLFASPESGATTQKHTPTSHTSSASKSHARTGSRGGEDGTAQQHQTEARETHLRAELAKLREINAVLTSVTTSLTEAGAKNMATVGQTVQNASTLLATWTRILSQTEYNQRLILDPAWGGATRDLEEEEAEEERRVAEAERRVREEERRREEERMRKEEEERRKAAAVAAGAASASGAARGKVRGVRGTGRGYVGVGGQAGRGRGSSSGVGARGGVAGTSTSASGIARSSSTRGRGRGLG